MASSETTDFSHVIDWTEAMEQCGDDEDFLRELLSDLRGEIDAQIVKIDEVLEVRANVGQRASDGHLSRLGGGGNNFLYFLRSARLFCLFSRLITFYQFSFYGRLTAPKETHC